MHWIWALVACAMIAAGILLPPPTQALPGAGGVDWRTPEVPDLLPPVCRTVDHLTAAAVKAGQDLGLIFTLHDEAEGIVRKIAVTWGTGVAAVYVFLDGCLVDRQLVPAPPLAQLSGDPG